MIKQLFSLENEISVSTWSPDKTPAPFSVNAKHPNGPFCWEENVDGSRALLAISSKFFWVEDAKPFFFIWNIFQIKKKKILHSIERAKRLVLTVNQLIREGSFLLKTWWISHNCIFFFCWFWNKKKKKILLELVTTLMWWILKFLLLLLKTKTILFFFYFSI